MIEKLAGRVFATRNAVHAAHWKTRSYAQHMALGSFYEALPEKIDEIVEAHQGSGKGLIGPIVEPAKINIDAILDHIRAEAEWIKANRDELAGGTPSIANMLDDLHGLYISTVYKLKYLA